MNRLFVGTKLEISVKPKKTEEADRRYRVLVLLQRSDRPKYWTFHCFHCQRPIGEILNADVEAVSDLVSMDSVDNVAFGYRCSNSYCRYWYFFKLN